MIAFDASVLVLFLNADAGVPTDPATKQPVEFARERINHLVGQIEKTASRIIIPTPALSEVLVHAGTATTAYLAKLNTHAAFKIAPFGQKAAIETALMIRAAHGLGDKRSGSKASWGKIKFDHQIVAIAKVEGASEIYSDDDDVRRLAELSGLVALSLSDIVLPPEIAQRKLPLTSHE